MIQESEPEEVNQIHVSERTIMLCGAVCATAALEYMAIYDFSKAAVFAANINLTIGVFTCQL